MPNSLFCVKSNSKKKIKGKSRISFSIYKKIVFTYFKIYFNEFYFEKNAIYFPFGGYLKKIKYRTWKQFQQLQSDPTKKVLKSSEEAIGFFWYMRPSEKMYVKVKLKKLTGTTNQIPMIERNYVKVFGKDLIPTFIQEYNSKRKHKLLYHRRCIQD